jgi:hypothetical protein
MGLTDRRALISLNSLEPFANFSSIMCVPGDYLRQFASVPGPHCQQITGVVWAVSWRWSRREAKFQDSLFAIEAGEADNVSFPKPVSVAL